MNFTASRRLLFGWALRHRWTAALCVMLAGALSCAANVDLKPPNGATRRIDFKPCGFASYHSAALCATYEVFENRQAQAGRKIGLSIVMLPALAADPEPDPVFFLAGGPGQGAAKIASGGEDELMTELRQRRDLIFVDQRGTGNSHPLHCNLSSGGATAQRYFEKLFPLEQVRRCRAELERNARLEFYTTPVAMGDLDEVRVAMGYDRINLYGVSYGSLAALEYLRQHPDRVRALALAGVATPAGKLPLHFVRGAEAAFHEMVLDCAAEENCRAAFPDPKADLVRVLDAFATGPITFQLRDPKTGKPQAVVLSREVFSERLRNLLYHVPSMSVVPLLLRRALHGDWVTFGKIVTQTSINASHTPAMGMYLSVTCSESVPFISEVEIERETGGTFMGDYRIKAHQRACREWTRGSIPEPYFEPVSSHVPVLMLSGELDGATPADLGAAAARFLPHSRQILLPHTAHAYTSPCVKALIAQFIVRGSVSELDTSCVESLRRPRFATELPVRYSR